MATEQETLERLRVHFYAGREPDPEPAPKPTSGGIKVELDDLADYLAAHPGAQLPKGKAMLCAKCGCTFESGEFRANYAIGWLCSYCYGLLALAPLSARCIHCYKKIAIDCWRYKLHSITAGSGGEWERWFVHQECERAMERLQRAA